MIGYDLLADRYDEIYEDRLGLAENSVVCRSLLRGPSNAVLDLGCGNGAAARLLASGGLIPLRYVGTDLSTKMLSNWHSPWINGQFTGQSMKWKHVGHGFAKVDGHTIDLVHQSMDHPLHDSVMREFDLVAALWSVSYMERSTVFQTLRQAASYCKGSGSRLVATIYTSTFEKTKYAVQQHEKILTVADDQFVKSLEYETPWRITECRGLTGPVGRFLNGRAYSVASMVDRVIASRNRHTYILIEAVIP